MSKAWLSVLFVLQLGAGLVLGVASAQQSPPVDVVAPAAMVAAPPVMIAPAASHGLSLPDPFRLDMLIRSTLIALNQANDTGNYTVFRDLGSSAFQGANSAADLAGLFGNLRRQRIDLMPIIFVAPKPTQPPQIDNRGLLRLVGYFPAAAGQIRSRLSAGRHRLEALCHLGVAGAGGAGGRADRADRAARHPRRDPQAGAADPCPADHPQAQADSAGRGPRGGFRAIATRCSP